MYEFIDAKKSYSDYTPDEVDAILDVNKLDTNDSEQFPKDIVAFRIAVAEIAAHGTSDERARAAEYPGFSDDMIKTLSTDSDERVRAGLAKSYNVYGHPELIPLFAHDSSALVRASLYSTSLLNHLSVDDIQIAAHDPDFTVRGAIAGNPCTPVEIISNLSHDEHFAVRCNAAVNPHCPDDDLLRLSRDADMRVCLYVAENKGAPAEILADLYEMNDATINHSLAGNTATPVGILRQLAADRENWDVLSANTRTSADTLDALATVTYNDPIFATVADNVAKNTSTWDATLKMMAGSELPYIVDSATKTLAKRHAEALAFKHKQVLSMDKRNPEFPDSVFENSGKILYGPSFSDFS